MKAFSHVGNTWLLAQLLNPLVFLGFYFFALHQTPDVGLLASLLLASALFSLPSLFLSFLLLHVISATGLSLRANFLIWLMLVLVCILLNLSLLALLVGDMNFVIERWVFFLPSLIAAVFSILIRYKNFAQFITTQIKNYETQDDDYY